MRTTALPAHFHSDLAPASRLPEAASASPFAEFGGPSASGRPFITIAIPAYNRPLMLAETLASIAAQTAQVNLEVIICDDGGLPETRAVVNKYSHKGYLYVANPKALGAVANWNRCLELARGDWVMVLHEDDLLYPWYLESVLDHLDREVVAVCTRTSQGVTVPAVRPTANPESRAYPARYFLKSSMTPFPGVLINRRVAERLGGFNESWGPLADYEFWYRLACAGRIEVVRTIGAFYRVAPGQWTERIWKRMLRQTHLLRLQIAREQFPESPRLGRWMARFFTSRNARCYCARFGTGSSILRRCRRLGRIPLGRLPAGWVWRALKFASGSGPSQPLTAAHGGGTAQIWSAGRGPDQLATAAAFGGSGAQSLAALDRDGSADGLAQGEAWNRNSNFRAGHSRQLA